MFVFHHGSPGRPPGAEMVMFVCPAADPGCERRDLPRAWVDADNKPISFTVEFRYGEAEVDPTLGKYMIERGLAQKTRLVSTPGRWS